MGREGLGDEDGGRAVGAADDADGSGFFRGKAEEKRADKGDKDTQLGSGAQQEGLGVGDQRAEVGHRADAEEDQRRVDAQLDAEVEDVQEAALLEHLPVVDGTGIVKVHVEHAGAGDVGEQHAEGDRQQQKGFIPLRNREISEHTGDPDHDQLLPTDVGKAGRGPDPLDALKKNV